MTEKLDENWQQLGTVSAGLISEIAERMEKEKKKEGAKKPVKHEENA